MYCPSCGDEYREGFRHCPECDVELVDELPTAGSEDSFDPDDFSLVDPVCVHTEAARSDAEVALSMLRAYGLRAYLAGSGLEQFSAAGSFGQMTRMPGPLNSIRIMVHPDDAPTARDLLREGTAAEPANEDLENETAPLHWWTAPGFVALILVIVGLFLVCAGIA